MATKMEMDREKLESFFCDWCDSDVKITHIDSPKNNGFSAITYLLELQVCDETKHWVVQISPSSGSGLFELYDMERSFRIQSDLYALHLPIAKMIFYCDDPAWVGGCFYVMEFVQGQIPPDRPSYHAAGWLFDANAMKQQLIWKIGVTAMADLHMIGIADFDYLTQIDGHTDNQTADEGLPMIGAVAASRITHWRRFANELENTRNRDQLLLLQALDLLEFELPAGQPLCISWGDAKPGNMIFDQDKVVAILDWELCGIGTPEEDLAHWLAVDWFLSSGIRKQRLPGLPDKQSTLSLYRSIHPVPLDEIAWWFKFALIRMGLIFHQGNHRAKLSSKSSAKSGGKVSKNPIVECLPAILDGSIWRDYARGS